MRDFWNEQWDRTRQRFEAWWEGHGLVLWIVSPREKQWEDVLKPPDPVSPLDRWLNTELRVQRAEYAMSWTYYGGESFPYLDTNFGPGSLATFIGSKPNYVDGTVWYEPCISDPENHPPFVFDPENESFKNHVALIKEGLRKGQGRFLTAVPDLIENIDTLSALRDAETLMIDMIERPDFVKQRVADINQIYFQAFDAIHELLETPWGGNVFSAFSIWGPGKTAKVQCDASAMFSPKMYKEFVIPALTEQCRWLDTSLFHLDGVQCIPHLDHLLEIEELNCIQWTPQAGKPGAGSPVWFDLYKRILAAGKGVQVLGCHPDEIIPLLDAVGPKGLYIFCGVESEEKARALLERLEPYRP